MRYFGILLALSSARITRYLVATLSARGLHSSDHTVVELRKRLGVARNRAQEESIDESTGSSRGLEHLIMGSIKIEIKGGLSLK